MRAICFCNSNIPWGGGEKWHLEAALSFAARGWKVFVLCHPQSLLFQQASVHPELHVRAVPIGRLSFFNPIRLLSLKGFFLREKIHAVVLNLPSDLKTAGTAAHLAGVPHILYRRGSAIPVRNSRFNRWLYQKVITRLVVNSEATGKLVLLENPHLIPVERITLLPNGMDAATFDSRLQGAQPLAWPEKTPPATVVLGNAGRLSKQKGQHFLLYLLKALGEAGISARLIIAGEGERRDELERLAHSLEIADRVLFTGFLSELAPFWKSIDAFVLSSLWEGFGYVLAEAMLAKKPITAFAVSNIPELVQDGVNGRLVALPEEKEGATPDLGEMIAVIRELAASPELRNRLGEAGRNLALSKFSQERSMQVLENLLTNPPKR